MLGNLAEHYRDGLRDETERLKEHLRQADRARGPLRLEDAQIRHAFELDVPHEIHLGGSIEIMWAGYRLGHTIVAPPIRPGRYRAVLLLERIEGDES